MEASPEGRDSWGAKTEYMLALIGYAVGIGNLWRFPYLCHRYGGGKYHTATVHCFVVNLLRE